MGAIAFSFVSSLFVEFEEKHKRTSGAVMILIMIGRVASLYAVYFYGWESTTWIYGELWHRDTYGFG